MCQLVHRSRLHALVLVTTVAVAGPSGVVHSAPEPVADLPEVVERGDGPTTLLLIGCMSCRWNVWEELMERNADRYRMVAVTLPGFGGTPMPELPLDGTGTPWRDNAIAALEALLESRGLQKVVVVAHSFGTMVATQLAARRPERIARLIAIDGSIESGSWTPSRHEEREAEAASVIENWRPKLADAEEWRVFNGAGPLPAGDTVTREAALAALRVVGGFMATPREVVLQYWRENPRVDLDAALRKLEIPVLDLQALWGDDQEQQRRDHLAHLAAAHAPAGVRARFLFDTRHFVMFDRPELLDRILEREIGGEPIEDWRPPADEGGD